MSWKDWVPGSIVGIGLALCVINFPVKYVQKLPPQQVCTEDKQPHPGQYWDLKTIYSKGPWPPKDPGPPMIVRDVQQGWVQYDVGRKTRDVRVPVDTFTALAFCLPMPGEPLPTFETPEFP